MEKALKLIFKAVNPVKSIAVLTAVSLIVSVVFGSGAAYGGMMPAAMPVIMLAIHPTREI